MKLTVKQLIAKLRRMDQAAYVAWQSHDQSDDECDGFVGDVGEADESLCESQGVRPIVVLR